MEELGLSGVDDLDGKMQHTAPTSCPPNSHGLTVIFNSRIASVAIGGVDIDLIVCNINFIIYYFSATKHFEAHRAG